MPHYYSEEQTSELNLTKINIKVKNTSFQMYSGSGVFSKKRLDKGTELLLKSLIVGEEDAVLDLGCGIGVVGIYVKKMFPRTEVTFSDVSRRATMLARKNLELHDIKGRTISSDGFTKIKKTFDTILFNPPQVAGKETCFRLISEAYEHLNPEGKLEIVARHNKGGKSYSEHMNKVFGNMEEVAIGSGYRIYLSRRNN